MLVNEFFVPEQIDYFFTRAKRTHEEEGITRITTFVRLTKESSFPSRQATSRKSESIWVDIREVAAREAAEPIALLPDHMIKFNVSEPVFSTLVRLAASSPDELFHTTPEYVTYEHC